MKMSWDYESRGDRQKHYKLEQQDPPVKPFRCDHRQDYAEIFYIKGGNATHHLNDRYYSMTKGDLIFVAPHEYVHSTQNWSKDFSFMQILFTDDTFSFIQERYKSTEWDAMWHSNGQCGLKLSPLRQKWFEDSYLRLSKEQNSLFQLERVLIDILGFISDTSKAIIQEAPDNWLRKALIAIQEPEHFFRGFQGFVDLCGRCPEHVAREVKKHTGLTVIDVVNQARMKWASDALLYTNSEITDIAYECGFKSMSYFSNLFKATFDIAPSRYRKLMQPDKIIHHSAFENLQTPLPY